MSFAKFEAMCYDIKTKLEAMLKRARYKNDETRIADLLKELEPYVQDDIFHASGFTHPKLLIYTNKDPYMPILSTWGLVPNWVKDEKQLQEIWNRTLNARGETIFDKASFRHSARQKRCLIYLTGFYEHHESKGNKYPFLIKRKDGEAMAVAGLWSEYTNRDTGEILNTFSIVTTHANPLMAKIHNNPKLPEPRMPVILPEDLVDNWLIPCNDETDKSLLLDLVHPYPSEELEAFPVRKIRGKDALGNVPESAERFDYPELKLQLN